jgi:hypothetical protein
MLLMAAMLAMAPLNADAIETPVVEQRVLKAWEGDHDFLVDFSAPFVPTTGNIKIQTIGNGAHFNEAYPWNWVLHTGKRIVYRNGYRQWENCDGFVNICLTLTKEEAQKNWMLGLSQLASLGPAPDGLRGYAPVSIEVNGEMIEHHYLPQVDAWREDFFPVALHEGTNSIVIRELNDATTVYWIQKLWLDPVSE